MLWFYVYPKQMRGFLKTVKPFEVIPKTQPRGITPAIT